MPLSCQKGVAPEMQLSLAYCQAPRVARTAEGVEEYFGWESREYLRKMIIGQVVKFKVLYKVDVISRTFGTIELKDKDVLRDMVSSGYVSVRSERDEKGSRELYEELLELQAEARDNHRGIWSPTKTLRHVSWTLDDPESFFQANKGMPMAAIVEQVRDGSTLKLYLLETGEMISLRLAGLQAPRIAYSADGKATYDAFAAESRCFSELRLLNRSVVIIIDGMDKFNVFPQLSSHLQNFFGRVEHPSGSLAKELLGAGLARVVDWSLNFLPVEEVSILRGAELEAKKQHLRLWKDWVEVMMSSDQQKAVNTTYAAIQGQVLQVMSGDTLIILLDGKDPLVPSSQRRVNLASVRAPKLGNLKKNVADEAWAQEAKEKLIHLAIGKKVKIVVEYERTSLVGTEEQTFTYCTVELMNGMNLAEELVSAGLVSVVRHRDDEARASNYDQLLLAENQAKQARVGLFNQKKPSIRHRVDFSETPAKAKTNLHFLKQKSRYHGFIEYVFSASHYLVHIPEENCQFSFNLQGVKAPLSSSRGKGESFGDESLMYAKLHFLQRDVTVEIVNVDKGGSFIGDLYMGNKKESIGLELLREGVVFINETSIDFCRQAELMEEAEETAKIVGLSAVKYGDLSNQASKDYIFDVERFTSSEGNTGPYILYTIVRIKSILRKYEESGKKAGEGKIGAGRSDSEKALQLELSKFNSVMETAFEECAPHKICAYIYDLANAFNKFYHETKILGSEDEAAKKSWIALLLLTRKVLETCIDLLGFEAPEKM